MCIDSTKFTRNFLSGGRRWRQDVAEDWPPGHGNGGNEPDDIENHDQSQNPGQQEEADEESHRSTEHKGNRYAEKQPRESRRRYVSHGKRRRKPRPTTSHHRWIGEVVRERNGHRRRTEERQNKGRQVVESPTRLFISLSSHHVGESRDNRYADGLGERKVLGVMETIMRFP